MPSFCRIRAPNALQNIFTMRSSPKCGTRVSICRMRAEKRAHFYPPWTYLKPIRAAPATVPSKAAVRHCGRFFCSLYCRSAGFPRRIGCLRCPPIFLLINNTVRFQSTSIFHVFRRRLSFSHHRRKPRTSLSCRLFSLRVNNSCENR